MKLAWALVCRAFGIAARAKLSEFFAALQPSRVVMEACGSAHYWARVLGDLGHQVELLPAKQVRAFVRSNKDDAADARAIWLAAQQSDIRRAPIKSTGQQAVLSLHRARSHWVRVRTATVNMVRAVLYEFGVVLPGGKNAGLKTISARRAEIDEQLPELVRRQVQLQLDALKDVQRNIDQLDAELQEQRRVLDKADGCYQLPPVHKQDEGDARYFEEVFHALYRPHGEVGPASVELIDEDHDRLVALGRHLRQSTAKSLHALLVGLIVFEAFRDELLQACRGGLLDRLHGLGDVLPELGIADRPMARGVQGELRRRGKQCGTKPLALPSSARDELRAARPRPSPTVLPRS